MRLVYLTCTGFRALDDLDFCPSPGINVIRGENAQGKTSLLEAVLFAATSKSHRTAQESELVRHGAEGFRLCATVQRRDREERLEAACWRGTKRFKVNGVAQTRISDILGRVHLVFFSPEDVGLVRGAASMRRRFLDMELSQLRSAYLHALQSYRLILRQRNELLRHRDPDPALLDVLDTQLAREGEKIMAERAGFVAVLATGAAAAYARIAGNEPLDAAYAPDIRPGQTLGDALRASRATDLRQGMTTRGPHRDDLDIRVGGRSARQFGSQGQQRTAALALKLAELGLVQAETGDPPVLMLDDVLSELDERRSRMLFETLPEEVQCLLTTTDLTDRAGLFGSSCAYFRIREGRLAQEEE
jgi:DNA replication and repair protein RecF